MLQLSDRKLRVAGIVHDMLGLLAFDVERPLAGLTAEQFLTAPAAILLHTIQSLLKSGFHKNQTLTHFVPARFEQQGGVQHNQFDRRIGLSCGDLFTENLLNPRMNDGFQFGPSLPCGRISTEHTPTQFAAIDVAVGIEHFRAKFQTELIANRLFIQHHMAGIVAVHDSQFVFFLQGAGQKAFSGPNAADQTDDRCWTSRRGHNIKQNTKG